MAPRRYGKASVTVCKDTYSESGSQSQDFEDSPAECATTEERTSAASSRVSYDFSANSATPTINDTPPKKKSRKIEQSPPPADMSRQNTQNAAISTHFIGNFGVERARLDDIEYLFDGLAVGQSSGVKINSATELAELCRDAEIRKTLRAHSLVEKVLQALKDAEGALAVSGASILYLLCRDSANIDLANLSACRVLVALLTCRNPPRQDHPAPVTAISRPFKKKPEMSKGGDQNGKTLDGVVKRLAAILPLDSCEASHLSEKYPTAQLDSSDAPGDVKNAPVADAVGWELDEVTAENLSFLCCTHLTQQHPSFRDCFRQAGGIPVAVKILMDSMLALILSLELGDAERPAMRRMRRDLRLIESLTFMSAENQGLVLQNECFLPELLKLVERLTRLLEDPQWAGDPSCRGAANEVRLGALKVLVNLTNHNPTGGRQVGGAAGIPAVVGMLRVCAAAKGMEDYDALTLGIGLLINCVEHNDDNRDQLASCGGAEGTVKFLVQLFLSKIQEDSGKLLLDKMRVDDLVVAAYTSVLVGCIIKNSEANAREALEALGARTVQPMVSVLDYFIACHQEADGGRTATQEFLDSLMQVLRVLGALL